jgi:hypothetical protein
VADAVEEHRARAASEARREDLAVVGDDLELAAACEPHAAHHVHLPELHGPEALPAAVVLALAAPPVRLDQPVAQKAAVDRGAPGERGELLAREVVEQRARPPARVLAA